MAMSCRAERSLLTFEEFELVARTHYPAIAELTAEELRETRTRLKGLHERERTLAEHKGRIARGKAEPRGGSFPGTAERPRQRRQVLAAALKRLNGEIARIGRLEARAAMSDAARRALALRRAAVVHHPTAAPTPGRGMAVRASGRRRRVLPPGQIGSVSQMTKASQARRDARG